MDLQWIGFGVIAIDGRRYEHDVVIEAGRVKRRHKGPSKHFRDRFGHTPLSADELLPLGGKRLIVGTGADGQLPIMDEVRQEAERRGIELMCCPTEEACGVLSGTPKREIHAVLHVTC